MSVLGLEHRFPGTYRKCPYLLSSLPSPSGYFGAKIAHWGSFQQKLSNSEMFTLLEKNSLAASLAKKQNNPPTHTLHYILLTYNISTFGWYLNGGQCRGNVSQEHQRLLTYHPWFMGHIFLETSYYKSQLFTVRTTMLRIFSNMTLCFDVYQSQFQQISVISGGSVAEFSLNS